MHRLISIIDFFQRILFLNKVGFFFLLSNTQGLKNGVRIFDRQGEG